MKSSTDLSLNYANWGEFLTSRLPVARHTEFLGVRGHLSIVQFTKPTMRCNFLPIVFAITTSIIADKDSAQPSEGAKLHDFRQEAYNTYDTIAMLNALNTEVIQYGSTPFSNADATRNLIPLLQKAKFKVHASETSLRPMRPLPVLRRANQRTLPQIIGITPTDT